MKKTYRINPFAFILFLFGLTLITVAPVKAQTQIEKLIERIEKLEAFHSDVGSESKSDSGNIEAPPAGPWDPSMGMRHPARPCMDRTKVPGGCGPDRRSPEQIASDPYDRNNPVSLAARGESGAASPPNRPSDDTPATVADGPWDPSMGMRHPARPCMKVNSCGPDKRSADQIARDPFDIINGVRQAEEEATRELAKKMSELAIRSPYLRKLNLQPPYRNYCNSVENRKRECAHRKGKWRGRAFAQNAACVNKYGVEIKTACQSP